MIKKNDLLTPFTQVDNTITLTNTVFVLVLIKSTFSMDI